MFSVLGVHVGLMCCYCMLVGWTHSSYESLREWSYRHRSHAVGRVQRQHRFSRYGEGDGEIVTLCVVIREYGFSC